MRPLRAIGRFIAFLWAFSRRSWVSVHEGLRPRSGASALVLFLFLLFFVVGLILLLLGFDLGHVDAWLDAHGGWFSAIGDLLFRLVSGAILLVCLIFLGSALYDLTKGKLRIGTILLSLLIGYFAWIGVSADL